MNMFKKDIHKTPEAYIKAQDPDRAKDLQQIHDLIREVAPELEPFMISGMIGYGKMHYKYPSGREGDWFKIGLASQKNYISIYVCAIDHKIGKYLAEIYAEDLKPASVGKSCIRYKKAADIKWPALKKIIKEAIHTPFTL